MLWIVLILIVFCEFSLKYNRSHSPRRIAGAGDARLRRARDEHLLRPVRPAAQVPHPPHHRRARHPRHRRSR